MKFQSGFIHLFLFIMAIGAGFAQDSIDVHKEYGLNLSPVLVHFIPLNVATTRTGPYNFTYKSYKGNVAFRTSIGVDVNSLLGPNLDHLNLRAGVEWRKKLSTKWSYTKGVDLLTTFGGFNIPSDDNRVRNSPFLGTNADLGVGAAASLGIEYWIMPNLYLSAESMLFLGLRTTTLLNMQVVPPMSIFLTAVLNKKKAPYIRSSSPKPTGF